MNERNCNGLCIARALYGSHDEMNMKAVYTVVIVAVQSNTIILSFFCIFKMKYKFTYSRNNNFSFPICCSCIHSYMYNTQSHLIYLLSFLLCCPIRNINITSSSLIIFFLRICCSYQNEKIIIKNPYFYTGSSPLESYVCIVSVYAYS